MTKYDKTQWTRQLKQYKFVIPVLEAGGPRSSVSRIGFFLSPPSLACGWLSFENSPELLFRGAEETEAFVGGVKLSAEQFTKHQEHTEGPRS